ncbi:nuclear transport factor 2 family protein [Thiobacillus sp.]|uniref:nuclear transport factor 2 family protein n=1 Tax=Thiobacillus sp. TaxID=924 RepID=UPI001ACDABBB|nr:nuclear transport factor 2 family protein [Thiobacillus sp.]MBN8779893.1 nuclear transport factor 2 family protein [Thiobacillus sp.]
MPLVTQEAAMTFAQGWIEAWNRHDLDAVLDLFSQDFEFCSPYVIELANEASGCLRDREAVHRYWQTGLARIPDLRFRLIDVLAGVSSLTIYYAGHRGMVAETFHLDGNGKAVKAVACYSVSSTRNVGGHDE